MIIQACKLGFNPFSTATSDIPWLQQKHDPEVQQKVILLYNMFQTTNNLGFELNHYIVHALLIKQQGKLEKVRTVLRKNGFLMRPTEEITELVEKQKEQLENCKKDAYESRQLGRQFEEKAKELGSQVYEALQIGDNEKAEDLRALRKEYKKKGREEREYAVKKIKWRYNQKYMQSVLVDLHGLHVEEAIEWMEQIHFIQLQKLFIFPGAQCTQVVTGKGVHSKDFMPKVKTAVIQWASEKNLVVIEHEGSLDIFYSPQN
eukprot:TRINITY_DN10936_c0_g1_i1.p3 TRINITY_DN10936_c0_g1~~TRINITY_DN10936_c0_g1_i1.p3  ORF type:complete len:298 (+),score=39.69 TRINITY_DN10936_c0_g1_i1:115-894(+)